ncbi:hypothetical protein ACHAW6_005981 [Cyclotella cf. meneghiniana]
MPSPHTRYQMQPMNPSSFLLLSSQPCGTGTLDGGPERSANFKKALDAFFGSSLPDLPVFEPGTSISTSSTPVLGTVVASETAPSISSGESFVDYGNVLSSSEWTTPATDPGTTYNLNTGQAESGGYYPDYNPTWSLGKCINDSPTPSGRPLYDSLIECCENAYGGQSSGACLSSMSTDTSIVEPSRDSTFTQASQAPGDHGELSETLWYPDYNPIWALGKCINLLPFPNGRPTYGTQLECCESAYRGQASGECLADTSDNPLTVPILSQSGLPLDMWYADFNPQWALGKCINESPVPANRPWYTSQTECCEKAYGGQASGACLDGAKESVSIQSDGLFADAYASYLQSRKYGDLIFYSCNPLPEIPPSSGAIDVSYEYEYSVPHSVRADLVLPDLKIRMMEHLAAMFGCQSAVQRNLRQTNEDVVLLGFQSAEGSDEIDTKKAYCKLSGDEDATAFTCVPVIGHLVAFFQQDTTREDVELTKTKILESLADGQYTSQDIQKVVYIGERHTNLHVSHVESAVESATESAAWIPVVAPLLCMIAIVLIGLFFMIRRRNAMQNREVYQEKSNFTDKAACNDYTARTSSAEIRVSFTDRKHPEYNEDEDDDDSIDGTDSPGSNALENYDRGQHSIAVPNSNFKQNWYEMDTTHMTDSDRSLSDSYYQNRGVNFVLSNGSSYSSVLPMAQYQHSAETESDNYSVERCR